MIIADTSVWIDYLNNVNSTHTTALDSALICGTLAIGDLIFLEILQGFRHDKDFRRTKRELEKLDQFEMFGRAMIEPCVHSFRALRKKGITIRGTADVIIATFCIENEIPLLFRDRDFLPFVNHLNLKPVV